MAGIDCSNCGAAAPPPATDGSVVCTYCGKLILAPSPPSAGAGPATAAPPVPAFVFTDASVSEVARRNMGTSDSLFYAPGLPPKKEHGARTGSASTLPAGATILALYDDTVFGGADDGFVLTAAGVHWKNIADDPQHLAWSEIDPETVAPTDDGVTVNAVSIAITDDDMRPRVAKAIRELAARALETA